MLTPDQKTIAGRPVHYAFGTTMAAAYGVLVEFWDVARQGRACHSESRYGWAPM